MGDTSNQVYEKAKKHALTMLSYDSLLALHRSWGQPEDHPRIAALKRLIHDGAKPSV